MNTIIKNSFLLIAVAFICNMSCTDDNFVIEEPVLYELDENERILEFDTREQFLLSMNNGDENVKVRSTDKNLPGTDLSDTESLYGTPEYSDFWSLYVPNPKFAKKLNKKGEIMVNDTIYQITPKGTYFYHKTKKSDFKKGIAVDSVGKMIGDKLYLITPDVYRYDTFGEEEGNGNVEYYGSTESSNNQVFLRSYGTNPDYNSFPYFNADRQTIVGKLIQNLIGAKKDFTVYYEHTDKRRVRGSFYSYNYAVYAECGAQGWTDLKNWIGWSKTPADELRVGWHNVLMITKIPDVYKNQLKNMKNLSNAALTPQYMDIPGSMYKVNVQTLIIPNFNATDFDRALKLGAPEVINLLKSWTNYSQVNTDPNLIYLITTNTHLITYIPNQDVIKYNCEEYTHVFESQVKFFITLNLLNLPNTMAEYASTLTSIIGNSAAQAYPTLADGEVHVAARFGTEWQGMKIKKDRDKSLSILLGE